MSVSEGEERDWKLALEKNFFFILFKKGVVNLKRPHRLYMGHPRTAKLFSFMSQRFFWTGLYKDVKNDYDSCLTCACIHSVIDYQHMKNVKAINPF